MPTKMAPSQKTQAQTPVVKALNAIFATSVPVIKETAIIGYIGEQDDMCCMELVLCIVAVRYISC